jgi:2-polyprenyl-3-methyl-5-hydroxy-6-metoxy-1,4-benzoquinol methylase
MKEISNKLRQHYEKTFDKYGATSAGVDWGTDTAKVIDRYERMLKIIDKNDHQHKSLLDVGCGYGGLLSYIESQNLLIDYTGIDVAENMINHAMLKHKNVTFILGDIFEVNFDKKFDYIVCNGLLTQKLDTSIRDMHNYVQQLIKKMFSLCNLGIVFNLMSTHINFFSDNLYYHNPVEMLAWCFCEITNYIKLDHSYPLNSKCNGAYEYTVYLFRQPSTAIF